MAKAKQPIVKRSMFSWIFDGNLKWQVLLLVIIGFLDDYRELSHRWKFVGQVLSALCMIYFSNTVLLSLGDLLSFGPVTSTGHRYF